MATALAAGRGDLVDDLLGRALVGALAGGLAAEVVDDDRGTLGREQQRLGAPDPAPGAGDDRDLAVEADPWTPPETNGQNDVDVRH